MANLFQRGASGAHRDAFALGERGNILHHLDQAAIIPHVAESESRKAPFEVCTWDAPHPYPCFHPERTPLTCPNVSSRLLVSKIVAALCLHLDKLSTTCGGICEHTAVLHNSVDCNGCVQEFFHILHTRTEGDGRLPVACRCCFGA